MQNFPLAGGGGGGLGVGDKGQKQMQKRCPIIKEAGSLQKWLLIPASQITALTAFQGLNYGCEQPVTRSLSQKPFYDNKTKGRLMSTLITKQL